MGRYVFRVRFMGGLDSFNSLKLSFPRLRGTKTSKTDNFEKFDNSNLSVGILCRYKYSSAAERVQLEKQRQKEKRKQAKTKKTWENVARNVEPEVNSHEKELQGLARR